MKEIETAIQAQVKSMVQNNILFKFLNDESFSATERLVRLAPCFAYFVLGFRDLQLYVLKYPAAEAKCDPYKKAINAHCHEDSTHWPWFLADLQTLGLDKETNYTSVIKYLWGKHTKEQRSSCYQLAILAETARDPILRFVYLLAFEINGRALFEKFLEIAEQSEADTGKKLLYFGRTHLAREIGGLHGQEDIENELFEMKLSPQIKIQALEIANKLLKIQGVEWNELGKSAYANHKW